MRCKKKILFVEIIFFCYVLLSAQTLQDFFTGYKKHDLELQQLQVAVKQAQNDLDRAKVENGAEVSVETGDTSLELSSDGTTLEGTPAATVSVPSINGTSITASIPMTVVSNSTSSATELDDAGFTVSTDIISSTSKTAALTIEQSERDLVLAQRDVDVRHIAVEEAFWNEVRDMYESAQTLASDKTTLYTKRSALDEVKAEGYAQYSSTYISAQLEVNSAERSVKEDERLLANSLSNFAVDCGFSKDTVKDLPSLPVSIASTKLIPIKTYDKHSYIDLEEALWTNMHNEKERQAETDFTLSADAGYGWSGIISDNSETSDSTHSILTGLSATYKGITASAGVSTPIEDPSKPTLDFSFAWDLSTGKTDVLDKKDDEYDRELEKLDIKTAEQSYEDELQTAETNYGDLVWTKKENSDNLAMYKKLYEDSTDWYKKGLIAASDFAQNKNSYEQAQYTSNLTDIDYVLYNLGIAQLFIDSENTDYTKTKEPADSSLKGEQ